MKGAKILGLLNPQNKKNKPNITLEIICQKSILPLEYNGYIKYIQNKIKNIISQYILMINAKNLYTSAFSKKNVPTICLNLVLIEHINVLNIKSFKIITDLLG